LKLCKDCEYFGTETFEMAKGQLARAPACHHPDCCDPIFGNVLPAEVARKSMAGGIYTFCGMQGKYFKLKEVTETIETVVDTSVIQLAK
jgi:hypothetical protein